MMDTAIRTQGPCRAVLPGSGASCLPLSPMRWTTNEWSQRDTSRANVWQLTSISVGHTYTNPPTHLHLHILAALQYSVRVERAQLIVPHIGLLASNEETQSDVAMIPYMRVYLAGVALRMPWMCEGVEYHRNQKHVMGIPGGDDCGNHLQRSEDNASESFGQALFGGGGGF